MRHKRQQAKKREQRVRKSRQKNSPIFTKKVGVVAVGTLMSLGTIYPVFAAAVGEKTDQTTVTTTNTGSSNPFAPTNIGSGSQTTVGNPNVPKPNTGNTDVNKPPPGATNPYNPNAGNGAASGGLTDPTKPNGGKLPSPGVPNEDGPLVYDPSTTVIENAEACAERTREIQKETSEIAIETAGTVFDVDEFWEKARDNGCLITAGEGISLANQITQLTGGSISSAIMSSVKSKLEEARKKMIESIIAKGCEIMLEAQQGALSPLDDLVKRYEIYSNPDYVGEKLNGKINKQIDDAVFNFDNKLNDIANKINEKKNRQPSQGGSSGGSGDLIAGSSNPASSSGNTNIEQVEKEAAEQMVKDLADSRNFVAYPLAYRYSLSNPSSSNDTRGRKHTHLHSLNSRNPIGTEIGSIDVNDAGTYNSSRDRVTVRGYEANNVNACTYIASISTINNEIRRIVNETGVADPSNQLIQPVNIRSAYWNNVTNHVRSAISNGYDCAEAATQVTGNGGSASAGAAQSSSGGVNYGAASNGATLPAPRQAQQAPQAQMRSGPTDIGLAVPQSSNNEASQYMRDRQADNNNATAPQQAPQQAPQDAPAQPQQSNQGSNPFSRMKNFFN